MEKLLHISDLTVYIGNKRILNNFNLNIDYGETHVIMGPNGTGKSTLAKILAGDIKGLTISGKIFFEGFDIMLLKPEELALKGVFLAFQHPVVIPGLTNIQFFRSFINSKRKYENLDPVDIIEFTIEVKELMKKLKLKDEFLYRSVNDGFSGGEKKKNEVLQMLLLKPKFTILDEIDSGLDIDSLKLIAENIISLFDKNNSRLIITHYNRILDYMDVDYVHILNNGSIVKTGRKDLIIEIEKMGYENIK